MENKTIQPHKKGQKHFGITNWAKIRSKDPSVDDENPELAYKKRFIKPQKSNEQG